MDKALDSDYICKSLNYCDGPLYIYENFTFYTEKVMRGKPSKPVIHPSGENFKFVHMTDAHLDLYYTTGTDEDCGLPQCCRNGTGTAGHWGGSICDIPVRTLDASLLQIKDLKPDFIIVTGDFAPHDVWNQSKSYNLKFQEVVSSRFKELIPEIPVYPIYGNHACYPINLCPVGEANWIAKPFVEHWGLGDEVFRSIIEHGGYVKKIRNLRIIGIDTNINNSGNLYLSFDSTDPLNCLKWLYSELLEAEKQNEKVFIFGHMSPGDVDTVGAWGKHFNVLMDRFEFTVAGQFYGHSHNDEIHINIGVFSKKATSIQWVGPSLTTFISLSPSFRQFSADIKTNELQDFIQYRLDLKSSNKHPEINPIWKEAYSFKSFYKLENLLPSTVLNRFKSLRDDESLAVKYLQNFNTNNEFPSKCDADCRHFTACKIENGVIEDVVSCQGLSESGLIYLFLQQFYPRWFYRLSE
jgi:sphingomyelin phosphodiesterase